VLAVAACWLVCPAAALDRSLEDASRRPGITVLAADGALLANYGDLYGTAYAVKDLPPICRVP